ncbi:MAG: hypothetical protein WDO18_13570 [Acidobacteriota bacterium]
MVTVPFSPAMTSVLVTSVIAAPPRPVLGIVRPFSAGLVRTLFGSVPVRRLPEDGSGLQIDRRNLRVRRLQ